MTSGQERPRCHRSSLWHPLTFSSLRLVLSGRNRENSSMRWRTALSPKIRALRTSILLPSSGANTPIERTGGMTTTRKRIGNRANSRGKRALVTGWFSRKSARPSCATCWTAGRPRLLTNRQVGDEHGAGGAPPSVAADVRTPGWCGSARRGRAGRCSAGVDVLVHNVGGARPYQGAFGHPRRGVAGPRWT